MDKISLELQYEAKLKEASEIKANLDAITKKELEARVGKYYKADEDHIVQYYFISELHFSSYSDSYYTAFNYWDFNNEFRINMVNVGVKHVKEDFTEISEERFNEIFKESINIKMKELKLKYNIVPIKNDGKKK